MINTEFFTFLRMAAVLAPICMPPMRTDARRQQAERRIAAFKEVAAEQRTPQDEIVLGAAIFMMSKAPSVEEMDFLVSGLTDDARATLVLEHCYWGTSTFDDLDEPARLHFFALLIEIELTRERGDLFEGERTLLGLDSRFEKVMGEFEARLSRGRLRRSRQRQAKVATAR
jgi:hypothetical protein